jgi:anti-sigma B factor antagonist
MELDVQELDGVTLIQVAGEVDGGTAPLLQDQVLVVARPGCRLVLDMSQVEFMSSAGLRVMLLLHRHISGSGQLVLAGLSEALQETMAATGFLKYFVLTDNVEIALEALRQ